MAERDIGGSGSGNGLIAGAIIVAALIVSWGSSRSEPRYQIAASDSAIVRLDSESGAMIACDRQTCRPIEQPTRSRSVGPLTIEFGGDAPVQQKPAPAPARP